MVAAVVVPVTLISLVVGGIVIMNIMLVSVTERTREIGIRKSLGARRFDIMLQILTEAVILAAAGGRSASCLAPSSRGLTAAFGVTLHVTLFYVFLSVFVSAAVGVVSGWYPASKASKLDPIAAMRAETMNISPRENVRMALDSHLVASLSLGADYPRHRYRHYHGSYCLFASYGLRAGVVTFFDELGPDNIFIFKTSGDPHQTFEQLKERRRRPINEPMRISSGAGAHGTGVSVALFIPRFRTVPRSRKGARF